MSFLQHGTCLCACCQLCKCVHALDCKAQVSWLMRKLLRLSMVVSCISFDKPHFNCQEVHSLSGPNCRGQHTQGQRKSSLLLGSSLCSAVHLCRCSQQDCDALDRPVAQDDVHCFLDTANALVTTTRPNTLPPYSRDTLAFRPQ